MPISRVHTLDALENGFFFLVENGSHIKSLENGISGDVPPPKKCICFFPYDVNICAANFWYPPFLRRAWLGACALRLLPDPIVYVLGLLWLRSKWNPWFIFSTNHNPVLGNSKICLIRWLGWCMLVPVNGPALMPYHSLELSLKGTNIP